MLVAIMLYLLEEGVFLILTCLFILLVVAQGLPVNEEDEFCALNYYLNTSAVGSECVPCSTCAAGYGVQTPCGNTTDTKCQPCLHGYYSQYSALVKNRLCTLCTNCTAQNRISVAECTLEEDSRCGKCTKGYFLSVNYDGSTECLKCSYCPSDENVVKWYECADLPENQQCAPGYSVPASTSHSPPPVTSPNQDLDDILSELRNHTRHGFITIPNPGIITSEEPPLDLGLVVSLVSLIFTIATLIVFLCALGCFIKQKCKRRVHQYRLSSTNRMSSS